MTIATGLFGPKPAALLALAVSLCLVTGCYFVPKSGRADASRATAVVRVMASPVLEPLLRTIEPMFEHDHPGVNLALDFGADEANVDQTDSIIRDINAGADTDLFIAGDALDVQRLMRAPTWTSAWAGNQLVVVRTVSSNLSMDDIFVGSCEVAIGITRSALGWRTEKTLEHINALTSVYPRLGRYSGSAHIMERVRWQGGGDWGPNQTAGDVLGIVYATDARHIRLRRRGSVRVVGVLPTVPGKPIMHTLAPYSHAGEALAEWLNSPKIQRVAHDLGYVK